MEQWHTSCPIKSIPLDITEAIRLSSFAHRGTWPCAGGVLDQAVSFIDACEVIWAEEDRWRAKLKLQHADHDG